MITPLIEPADLMAASPATILDVRWRLTGPGAPPAPNRQEYLDGHIHGAVFIDLEASLSAPPGEGGRHPLPDPAEFQAAMRRAGVRDERPVVVYDQGPSQAAARAWWLLSDAGHSDVRVLNGGFAAWRAAGGPVETGEVAAETSDWVARPGHRPVVDAAGAATLAGRLIDVRARERFVGDVEPIDPRAGHIPGAENVPVALLQDDAGRFLAGDRIRDVLGAMGSGDAFYCGSGITAAQALLAAEAAGYRHVAIYPGSWSDWCARDGAVATGC